MTGWINASTRCNGVWTCDIRLAGGILAIPACKTPGKTERGLEGKVDRRKGSVRVSPPHPSSSRFEWFRQPQFIQLDLASIKLSSQIELTHQIPAVKITLLIWTEGKAEKIQGNIYLISCAVRYVILRNCFGISAFAYRIDAHCSNASPQQSHRLLDFIRIHPLCASSTRVVMADPTERDPLIKNATGLSQDISTPGQHRNGPLDISRSRRYGILAGVWSATFLSVGDSHLRICTKSHHMMTFFKALNS